MQDIQTQNKTMQIKLDSCPNFKEKLDRFLREVGLIGGIVNKSYTGEITVKYNTGGILYIEILPEKMVVK